MAAAALALAFGLDAGFGELPNRWHPVRGLGVLFGWLERRAPRRPAAALAYGLAVAVGCAGVLAAVAAVAERVLLGGVPAAGPLSAGVAALAYAALLKPTFALRALVAAGQEVEQALRAGDIQTARHRVAWHLVSRPVDRLDGPRVAAAAIESLSENACDGVVAPLFWWAVAGLPGAWCYRLLNTLDAMWGYHGRYEFLGKGPARLDDVAGWVPARLTAVLLLATGGRRSGAMRSASAVWRRDAGRTESPNAGHPMSASAGLLGVRLEKVGAYTLYPEGRLPGPDDIRKARGFVRRTAGMAAALLAGVAAILESFPQLRLAVGLAAGVCGVAGVAVHAWRRRHRPPLAPGLFSPATPGLDSPPSAPRLDSPPAGERVRRELLALQPPVHGGLRAGESPEPVDFSANLNDFLPEPPLADWLAQVRWDRYPDPDATALRQALASAAGVPLETVWPGNGSCELITSLALACLRPGERVLVAGPTFAEYERACHVAHAAVHRASPPPGSPAFACWDPESLREAVEKVQPRLVWLCNPNNPTGHYLRRTQLESVIAATDALWVLDESYLPFVQAPDDWTDLAREGRVVLLRSLTKWFRVPGLRLGYVVASPDVVHGVRMAQPAWSVNAAAQLVGVRLLAWPHPRGAALRELAAARAELADGLAGLGFAVLASETNFLLVRVGDGAAVAAALRRWGVVVRDAASFGLPEWIRVTVRRPEANRRLLEGLARWRRGC